MAKFKKDDLVRCVGDEDTGIHLGNVYIVDGCSDTIVLFKDEGGFLRRRWASDYELATPSPIPDTVTIGGVEYVRKPEPEHVWAWGQWARVNEGCREGEKVFVTGPVKDNGYVPVTYKDCDGINHTNGFYPQKLTYIGTATIPE